MLLLLPRSVGGEHGVAHCHAVPLSELEGGMQVVAPKGLCHHCLFPKARTEYSGNTQATVKGKQPFTFKPEGALMEQTRCIQQEEKASRDWQRLQKGLRHSPLGPFCSPFSWNEPKAPSVGPDVVPPWGGTPQAEERI